VFDNDRLVCDNNIVFDILVYSIISIGYYIIRYSCLDIVISILLCC